MQRVKDQELFTPIAPLSYPLLVSTKVWCDHFLTRICILLSSPWLSPYFRHYHLLPKIASMLGSCCFHPCP